MTSSQSTSIMDKQLSLFAIGTVLVRSRWRIARWAVMGGVIAAVAAFTKPTLYSGTFAFVPQGSDAARSGLVSLAGQLGLSTPVGTASQQPDFYVALLQSRELLVPILLDSFIVEEDSGRNAALLDMLNVRGKSPANRVENGVKKLRGRLTTSVTRSAGIIRVSIRTEWRSVSLAISRRLLDGVNEYNVRARQGQASAERKFVEGRLSDAKDSLRAAEERLAVFLTANRGGIQTSPHLSSAWQRFEREVASKTTLVTGLMTESEETRIREVRDTPTIAVFESPSAATIPDPRRRVVTAALGVVLGTGLGVVLALFGAAIRWRRSINDPDADAFFDALNESKDALLRRQRSQAS